MQTSLPLLALLATASLLGPAVPVRAQSGTPRDPYVITSAPYTINRPGYYLLGNNLDYPSTSGNIITISASNVTLDFNGFYIAGAMGNTGQSTVGVYATEKSNLTIKNGTIAYCKTGISLVGNNSSATNAVGAVVDNLRVTYCYATGIYAEYYPASRVTNCQVSQIGYSGASTAYGISWYDAGAVTQNTVSTVTATSSYGIFAASSFARQNTVSGAKYGVYGGKYQDNLMLNCPTPYTGGYDAGGNN